MARLDLRSRIRRCFSHQAHGRTFGLHVIFL
jgi:hypothetical protein